MNHFKFLLLLVFFISAAFTLHAKELKVHPVDEKDAAYDMEISNSISPDTLMNEDASIDLVQLILGKWELAPNNRATEGFIIFNQNGTYEMYEKLIDGAGVSKKGEYLLYSNASPVKIDICLGKCNQDGSEWTTLFGIIRVISNEKLEIRTSPSSAYPLEFSDDKSDEGTIILSRTK